MVVGITIMETNKMGHFVCGVLATYGLVVACGNMEELSETEDLNKVNGGGASLCGDFYKLSKDKNSDEEILLEKYE